MTFFKRIEMTGFKSFASKTVVDFKDGVTVVVGPNGCGKSNIFDAIRWVLGEQSAKSLRGSKMGDVIFQGSATYKPMGCAQVTLVINNEGHRLPIDFSEVSLTRRLYRSGESEYQINKSPCRLRDINELFLDTGVGTDSYSIMEQGRVDDIVKSRPEDRRMLFEEAAGISKYKVRKQEALRKLERTESDLVRLADRIAESRTRRNSLKRQATKAEKYKGLKDAADTIEMKLLAIDYERVQGSVDEIEKEYSEAKDQLAVVRAEHDKVESKRETLQLQIQDADDALRDLATQREDQRQYISRIAMEIQQLQSKAESERRRAGDMDEQVDDIELRRSEFSRNLADANAEEARLIVRLTQLQSKQAIRRAEYERLRADSNSTREKIVQARRAMDAKNEEMLRLRGERDRLQFQLEAAHGSINEFNKDRSSHEETIERLEREITEARESLDSSRKRLEALEAERKQAKEEAMEATRAREVLLGEHRQAQRELDDATSRLEALERLAADYEGYYGGVRSVMQAARDGLLRGIIGVVPELIQSIDSEHDLAIEIALGNHVQDIVVETAEDAKRAINYLKSEGQGRATFLPLDIIESYDVNQQTEQTLYQTGVVGLASRLVTYDSSLEKAVSHLLGRTIVTETTDVSLSLVRSGKRGRYVTLDGQLTAPGGAMTGGSRRQSQIVSRQREITELKDKTLELGTKVGDFAGRIEKRERAMANLAKRDEEVRSELEELRLNMGRGETQLAALRESRDQRRTILDEMREKAERSQEGVDKIQGQLEVCETKIVEAEDGLNARREEIALMESAIYDSTQEVDSLGERVSAVDREIASLSTEAAHLRERSQELAGEREHLERRTTQIRAEQERTRDEAHRLDLRAKRLVTERDQLEGELSTISDQVKEAAKLKEDAVSALRGEGEMSQKLMSDLTAAQNRYNEAQAEHINATSDMKRLSERSVDRFERDLADLVQEIGKVEEKRIDLSNELSKLKNELSRMGDNINMGALVEYKEEDERYTFLTNQEEDLMKARDSLLETIETIDQTTSKLFWDAFEQIRENFIQVYRRLFGGGKADLMLQEVEDGDSLLDGGIDILAQPPGKKLQNISLLSGGERALTAVSLMFAIFMYKPSPFCVLDEIDAPLDDANVARLREMLREFARNTQFIIISHNKITMDLADSIYGITMQETGVSSLVSVSFDQVDELQAEGAAS